MNAALTPRRAISAAVVPYVSLAAVVGAVVAMPTLWLDTFASRLLGVAASTGFIALLALLAARGLRMASQRDSAIHTQLLVTEPALEVVEEVGPAVGVRMFRSFRRVHLIVRLWPVTTCAGLVAGGAMGAATDSYLLTVALAATGLLAASVLTALPILLQFRRVEAIRLR